MNSGQALLGLAHMYSSEGIIEGMGGGWDFVWIDMQHGQHDFHSTLNAIRASECTGLHSIVRVPGHSPETAQKVADMDPDGIMIPMVNDARDAERAVNALCFPPVGDRSYGGRRVIDRHGRDFYKDRGLVTIVQIETPEAVEQAEAIAATEGVDVLFFGSDDMKLRMGLDLAVSAEQNNDLAEAQRKVAAAAASAGKWSGIVSTSPESVNLHLQMGYQLVVGGGDIGFLRSGASRQLETLKNAISHESVNKTDGATGGLYGN